MTDHGENQRPRLGISSKSKDGGKDSIPLRHSGGNSPNTSSLKKRQASSMAEREGLLEATVVLTIFDFWDFLKSRAAFWAWEDEEKSLLR